MKKIIAMVALVFSCMLAYAQTNGEVIVMNKAMFIKDVFDYEKSQDWKYKGNKPAIIDLYADWCGPCRMVAPIMKELAKSMPIKSLSTKSMWIRKRNWQRCSMQQASLFLYSSL